MKPENKDKWSLWQRNVIDRYKDLPTEEVKALLKKSVLPAAVLMTQIEGDFNIGSVIRASNNFNLSCVFYYGKKGYDKRAACGTYNYTDVIHLSSLNEILDLKKDFIFVGLENNIDKKVLPLESFKWQSNSLIIVGEENAGIPAEILDACDYYIDIPSRGSVRSLNAAVAASIAMYDYLCKMGISR